MPNFAELCRERAVAVFKHLVTTAGEDEVVQDVLEQLDRQDNYDQLSVVIAQAFNVESEKISGYLVTGIGIHLISFLKKWSEMGNEEREAYVRLLEGYQTSEQKSDSDAPITSSD